MVVNALKSSTLLHLLSDEEVRYGDPLSFKGLSLVPLFTVRAAPFDYVLVARAVAAGTFVIEEVGRGTVPTLRVVNKGDRPVLLIDGEHLVGVKQNRVLNTTMLVPEKTALDIPVSCVERGRWSAPRDAARPASPYLFVGTRAAQAEAVTASVRDSGVYASDQSMIWARVEGTLSSLSAVSPTSAMHAAYEQRAGDLGEYLAHLRWQPGQTGVVAGVGGRIVCADLFDRPSTMEALWERLIPSYAVEAMAKGDWVGRTVEALGGVTVADAQAFLRGVRDATITEHPAIGRGTDLRITGDGLVGAALEVDGAIVHLAMFRTEGRGLWRQPSGFATMAERRGRFPQS
jgi:hypothetical protein